MIVARVGRLAAAVGLENGAILSFVRAGGTARRLAGARTSF
jgi:hypothetical protein